MSRAPILARAPVAVVRVTGEDRLKYLEDVTTQRILDAPVGTVRGSLYLDARGNVLAVMDVVVGEDDVRLLVPAELVDTVLEQLGGRTFLADASFSGTDLEVWSLRGEDADALAKDAGLAAPPGEAVDHGPVTAIGRDGGVDVVGEPDALSDVVDRLLDAGARQVAGDDLEDWRIRAGIPRWGRELTPGNLPEELGLLPTHVHLDKGCYPGQEAVARMWMLGRPRRQLALVDADGAVAEGWEAGEGRDRVQVTSVTTDGAVALAFVPPGTEPGAEFDADGGSVRVRRLVGAGIDVPGHDPRMTRRRDRRTARGDRDDE